jgi:hypothetical protein
LKSLLLDERDRRLKDILEKQGFSPNKWYTGMKWVRGDMTVKELNRLIEDGTHSPVVDELLSTNIIFLMVACVA